MASNVTSRIRDRSTLAPPSRISGGAPDDTPAERRAEPVFLPQVLDRSRLIGVDQAAELFNYSVAHVRKLYRTGKLPRPVTIGGNKLGWPAGVLLDFIDGAPHREVA